MVCCWVASCGCCWMRTGSPMFRFGCTCPIRWSSGRRQGSWVDGFFTDGALLLIHDAELRRLLDEWVSQLDEAQFVDMLPLLRRTFGTFAPAERQAIAERIALGTRSLDRQLSGGGGPGVGSARWQPSISFWAGVMTEAGQRTELQTRLCAGG